MTLVLSYIPFVHPLNVFQEWWYLLVIPLSFGISMIYKAMRMATLESYWRHVTIMTAQIVLAMVILAVGLSVFVQTVVPLLPVGR